MTIGAISITLYLSQSVKSGLMTQWTIRITVITEVSNTTANILRGGNYNEVTLMVTDSTVLHVMRFHPLIPTWTLRIHVHGAIRHCYHQYQYLTACPLPHLPLRFTL